jgi:hypothetical protein
MLPAIQPCWALCYTPPMAKKITLETLAAEIRKGFASIEARVEKGFAAVAEDLATLATKEQLAGLQTQVNSIEQQLRETKTEVRLGALEEKVFGASRR